jgi:hypothetical protein
MEADEEVVGAYLQRYRLGHRDEAFFGLLELDESILPALMAQFKKERDAKVRAFLVEVIWQHLRVSMIPWMDSWPWLRQRRMRCCSRPQVDHMLRQISGGGLRKPLDK